ncbi:cytochrome P450 [Pseudoroseicyclus aestuarii]|uniref:Cytochrome P450 n=1 Tax=Pseudoroseicyclus aestuarii TaxID=1795041 RepID=A0A318STF8_9RHOB|nr:cytochrome P450 [Pseudoroseicyclus aestuarii]PYE81407.1 cytochrome P450 [Pseudoroseicyclus aestuarii]
MPAWRYLRLFRADLLSAQPARLYRAKMAELRLPLLRSVLLNDPDLVDLVLRQRPGDFGKSRRVTRGLRPLLGRSVFVTGGEDWARQRRLIDPAFAGGRLRETFPAMRSAAEAACARLEARCGTLTEIEAEASHAAADVIFRSLFSMPIEAQAAGEVFEAFRAHQRLQPVLSLGALLPPWLPRVHGRRTRATARQIRGLIAGLVAQRSAALGRGEAPDDLASKIMTARDAEGEGFSPEEMIDQVAIFFLAGHETSAAALGWALYLLAAHPDWQDRVAAEARGWDGSFAGLSGLGVTRDVLRETLRLYPPVPMMVREAARPERFRGRAVPRGAQIVVSPWHLHRHERLWEAPDAFDPGRWNSAAGRQSARRAYLPFSAGPRACPGAGFAMTEGVLLLAVLLRKLRLAPGPVPVPVAHLTVRAKDGIWLQLERREKA